MGGNMPDFLRVRLSEPLRVAEVGRLQDNIWTSLTPINAKMAQSTAWTVITEFLNGWGPYDPSEATFHRPAYRVDLEGFVHLRGILTDASGAAVASLTLPAFRLPRALAPSKTWVFPISANSLFGEARADKTGGVYVTPPSAVTGASLDGIAWQAGG